MWKYGIIELGQDTEIDKTLKMRAHKKNMLKNTYKN